MPTHAPHSARLLPANTQILLLLIDHLASIGYHLLKPLQLILLPRPRSGLLLHRVLHLDNLDLLDERLGQLQLAALGNHVERLLQCLVRRSRRAIVLVQAADVHGPSVDLHGLGVGAHRRVQVVRRRVQPGAGVRLRDVLLHVRF